MSQIRGQYYLDCLGEEQADCREGGRRLLRPRPQGVELFRLLEGSLRPEPLDVGQSDVSVARSLLKLHFRISRLQHISLKSSFIFLSIRKYNECIQFMQSR